MTAVSIVIPTYNRAAQLAECLVALNLQQDAYFEVIVVDDASKDVTLDSLFSIRTNYPLKVLRQPRNMGPAAARNLGIQESKGDILLFVDDDVIPEQRLIANHLSAHAGSRDRVVIGPMRAPSGKRLSLWARWEQDALDRQYAALLQGRFQPSARQFYTANASVFKEHLISVGGFDPTFRRAEDVELAYRLQEAGMEFVFCRDAMVVHRPRRSLRAWWAIPEQYGVADVRMWRDKNQRYLLKTIARELGRRSWPVRTSVRLTASSPLSTNATACAALLFGMLAGAFGLAHLSRKGFSLAYNLRYFSGISSELDHPALFRSLVRGSEYLDADAAPSRAL